MSLVVVRCPGCLGASRVTADALGQMVACPRCDVPFVAAEEVVPTVQPKTAKMCLPRFWVGQRQAESILSKRPSVSPSLMGIGNLSTVRKDLEPIPGPHARMSATLSLETLRAIRHHRPKSNSTTSNSIRRRCIMLLTVSRKSCLA